MNADISIGEAAENANTNHSAFNKTVNRIVAVCSIYFDIDEPTLLTALKTKEKLIWDAFFKDDNPGGTLVVATKSMDGEPHEKSITVHTGLDNVLIDVDCAISFIAVQESEGTETNASSRFVILPFVWNHGVSSSNLSRKFLTKAIQPLLDHQLYVHRNDEKLQYNLNEAMNGINSVCNILKQVESKSAVRHAHFSVGASLSKVNRYMGDEAKNWNIHIPSDEMLEDIKNNVTEWSVEIARILGIYSSTLGYDYESESSDSSYCIEDENSASSSETESQSALGYSSSAGSSLEVPTGYGVGYSEMRDNISIRSSSNSCACDQVMNIRDEVNFWANYETAIVDMLTQVESPTVEYTLGLLEFNMVKVNYIYCFDDAIDTAGQVLEYVENINMFMREYPVDAFRNAHTTDVLGEAISSVLKYLGKMKYLKYYTNKRLTDVVVGISVDLLHGCYNIIRKYVASSLVDDTACDPFKPLGELLNTWNNGLSHLKRQLEVDPDATLTFSTKQAISRIAELKDILDQLHQCKRKHKTISNYVELLMEMKRSFGNIDCNRHCLQKSTSAEDKQESAFLVNELYRCFLLNMFETLPEEQGSIDDVKDLAPHINSFLYALNDLESLIRDELHFFAGPVDVIDGVPQLLRYLKKVAASSRSEMLQPDAFESVIHVLSSELGMFKYEKDGTVLYSGASVDYLPVHEIPKKTLQIAHARGMAQSIRKVLGQLCQFTSNGSLEELQGSLGALWKDIFHSKAEVLTEYNMNMDKEILEPVDGHDSNPCLYVALPFDCPLDTATQSVYEEYLGKCEGVLSPNSIASRLHIVLMIKSLCETADAILGIEPNQSDDIKPVPTPTLPKGMLTTLRNTKWNALIDSNGIADVFTTCNRLFLTGSQRVAALSIADVICGYMVSMTASEVFRTLEMHLRQLAAHKNANETDFGPSNTKWLQTQVTQIIQRWKEVSVQRWCSTYSDRASCVDDYTVLLLEENDVIYLDPPLDEVRRYLYNKLDECVSVPKDVTDKICTVCNFEDSDILVDSHTHLEPAYRTIEAALTNLEHHAERWRHFQVTWETHFEEKLNLHIETSVILNELDGVLANNLMIAPQQIPPLKLIISEDLQKHKLGLLERSTLSKMCEAALKPSIDLLNMVTRLGKSMGIDHCDTDSVIPKPSELPSLTNDELQNTPFPAKPLWIDFDCEAFKGLIDNLQDQISTTGKLEITDSCIDAVVSLDVLLKPLSEVCIAKDEISKYHNEWLKSVSGFRLIEDVCADRKCCMPTSWISPKKLEGHIIQLAAASNTISEEFILWARNSISDLSSVYAQLHKVVKLDWNKLKDKIDTNHIDYVYICGLLMDVKSRAAVIHDGLTAIAAILKITSDENEVICADTCMMEIVEYSQQWSGVQGNISQYYNILDSEVTKQTFTHLKHELERIQTVIEGHHLVWKVMAKDFVNLEQLMNGSIGQLLYERNFIVRVLSIANELHPSIITMGKSFLAVKDWLLLNSVMHQEIKGVVDFMEFQKSVKEYLDVVRSKWVNTNVVWKSELTGLKILSGDGSRELTLWEMTNSQSIVYNVDDWAAFLQTYTSSKYADELKEELDHWNHKLSVTRTCIEHWTDVESRLSYICKIFLSLSVQKHLKEQYEALLGLLVQQESIAHSMECLKDVHKWATSLAAMVEGINTLEGRLRDYLDDQRFVCPRFFFLRNYDLFRIVGYVDIAELQLHISKMFPGIYQLQVDGGLIHGMISKESEVVPFASGLTYANVDSKDLLICIEREMKRALKDQIVSSVNELNNIYSVTKFDSDSYCVWIRNYTSQVLILSLSVLWTRSMEEMKANNDLETLCSLLTLLIETTICISNDGALMSMKVEQISIFLIYQINKSKHIDLSNRCGFDWERCIRYYLKDNGLVELRIGSMVYQYGYEYLGLGQELILTSLTEKCFVSISQGMQSHLIGNPQGPAGTGKTESIKALANLCGYPFLVFNCNESFDSCTMERTFAGLCQLGAWGIFDEFNRLTEGVLSAIAERIGEINLCQKNGSKGIKLLGREIDFNSNVSVFVTTNPGYLSRSAFPMNMRMLCRPIVMEQMNLKEVISVLLNVSGVIKAHTIANLIWNTLNCCRLCFSEDIYDFGLRCAKLILYFIRRFVRSIDKSAAGEYPHYPYCLLEKALLSVIAPRLPLSKLPSLDLIIRSCLGNSLRAAFGTVCPSLVSREENFTTQLNFKLRDGLDTGYMKTKAVELLHLLEASKGVIVYGPTGSGKTICLNTVLDASKGGDQPTYDIVRFDPNALEYDELFGHVNQGEWEDGLFTSIVRKFANTEEKVLIVFDGDVDSSWIENMNSVLDDNMVLTLSNGNRIHLTNNITIVFETDCLKRLTLATISRCALVRFETIQSSSLFGSYAKYFSILEPEDILTRYNLFQSFYNKSKSGMSNFIFAFVNAYGSQLNSIGYVDFIQRVDAISKKCDDSFVSYEEAEISVLASNHMAKVDYMVSTLVSNSTPFVLRCYSDSCETNIINESITSLGGWFVAVLYLCKGCDGGTLLDVLYRHCSLTSINSKYVMSPVGRNGASAKMLLIIKDVEVTLSYKGRYGSFWPVLRQIIELGLFYTRGGADNQWIAVHVRNVSIILTTSSLNYKIIPQRLRRLLPIINGSNYITVSATLDSFQPGVFTKDAEADFNMDAPHQQYISKCIRMLIADAFPFSFHDFLLFQSFTTDSTIGQDAAWLCQTMMKYKYGHSIEMYTQPSLNPDEKVPNIDIPWLFESNLPMIGAIKERIRFMRYFYQVKSNLLTITGGDKSLRELLSQGVTKESGYRLISFERGLWPLRILEILEDIYIHSEKVCIFIDWDILSLQSPEILCHLKTMILQRDYTAIATSTFLKELHHRHNEPEDAGSEHYSYKFASTIGYNLKFIVSSRERNFDVSMITMGLYLPLPELSSPFMGDICHSLLRDEVPCDIRCVYYIYLCFCGGYPRFCDYALFVRAVKDIMTNQMQKHHSDHAYLLSGIEKIERAKDEVYSMRQVLDSRRNFLVSKNEEAGDKLAQIKALQEEADAKAKVAQSLTVNLEEERLILQARRDEISRQLEQVSPLLEQSKQEVGSINRKSLDELRSMGNPPSIIKHTVETVVILLTNSKLPGLSWDHCRKVLKGADFIAKILGFDPKHTDSTTFAIVKNRLSEQDWDIGRISKASKAAGPLAKWVASIVTYTEIAIKVRPLLDEVERLKSSNEENEYLLSTQSVILEGLENDVLRYKDDYSSLMASISSVQSEIEATSARISKSEYLVMNLSSEVDRWKNSVTLLERNVTCILGDSILEAAMISLTGSIKAKQREEFYRLTTGFLSGNGICYSYNYATELNFDRYILQSNLKYRHCILVDAPDMLYSSLIDGPYKVVSACDDHFLAILSSGKECELTLLVTDLVHSTSQIKCAVFNEIRTKDPDRGFNILLQLSSDDLRRCRRLETEDDYHLLDISDLCLVLLLTMSPRSFETYCVDILIKDSDPSLHAANEEVRLTVVRLENEIRKKEQTLLAFLLETGGIQEKL